MRRFVLPLLLFASAFAAQASTFDVSVTFDDLPVATAPREPFPSQQSITRRLTDAVKARRIPVAGFVNANKLLVDGNVDGARVDLLRSWLDAGAELGNHTFSHRDLHRLSEAEFESEVVRGETGLRELLRRRGRQLRWFRHPFLHTGTTSKMRRQAEAFLAQRGYRVAPVTVDNSDWIFARAYDAATNDREMMRRIRTDYVAYMVAKVRYYRAQARQLFHREIPQVLLVHASRINADAFGPLADALLADGAHFVSLEAAVKDDAYRSRDTYVGPAGISWIHRWALSAGATSSFFAGEPPAPKYILQLAGVESE